MALAVGDRIGPYEIATSLGAGGMGAVTEPRTPASAAPSPSRS